MRYRARVDKNQKEIVKYFRDNKCLVLHLHTIGQGCPDLLVEIKGHLVLVEVKDKSVLTPAQIEFHRKWSTSVIINSIADAKKLIDNYG